MTDPKGDCTAIADQTGHCTAMARPSRFRLYSKRLVIIAEGFHPFPFRTRKLSPPAPMVLPIGGRVGRRQTFFCVLTTPPVSSGHTRRWTTTVTRVVPQAKPNQACTADAIASRNMPTGTIPTGQVCTAGTSSRGTHRRPNVVRSRRQTFFYAQKHKRRLVYLKRSAYADCET